MASEANPAGPAEGSHHRRFAVNVASSFGSLAASVLVGLWYTPFMIKSLGVAVYGLVPLASSITTYLTILTGAVCTTIARYITVDLARGDVDNANRHFNTFLVVGVVLAGALFALAVGFSFFLPVFFNIPAGQERPARYVFLGVAGAFLISTVANTFQASLWVTNRFEIRSMIETSAVLLRAGLILLSFRLWAPGLWQVAIIIPAIAGFGLIADVAACRALVPSLRVRMSDVDRGKLPELWSTSQWLLLSQVGNLLFLNIDLVLINIFLGPVESGRYSPLLQWVVLLRTVMSLIAGTLSPPIVVRYARQDMEGLLRLSGQAAKFLGLIVALPVGLLSGLGKPVLGTWLGPSFMDLSPLIWVVLMPLVIEAAQYHLSAITIAANKLRLPALTVLGFGVGNVGLAILLTAHFHWGLYGVAVAGAVTQLLRNGLFSPMYSAFLLEQRWSVFLKTTGGALVACLVLAGTSALISPFVRPGSWVRLGIAAVPIAAVYAGVTYFFLLDDEERLTLRKIARSSLRLES
jgi:O-antigen/teichoic acid export membrane protein